MLLTIITFNNAGSVKYPIKRNKSSRKRIKNNESNKEKKKERNNTDYHFTLCRNASVIYELPYENKLV